MFHKQIWVTLPVNPQAQDRRSQPKSAGKSYPPYRPLRIRKEKAGNPEGNPVQTRVAAPAQNKWKQRLISARAGALRRDPWLTEIPYH